VDLTVELFIVYQYNNCRHEHQTLLNKASKFLLDKKSD